MLRKAWAVSNKFGGDASQKGHPEQPSLSFGAAASVRHRRRSKREEIQEFFAKRIGSPVASAHIHQVFGSAARTRISELNRSSDCPIFIRNRVSILGDGTEASAYTAEVRL